MLLRYYGHDYRISDSQALQPITTGQGGEVPWEVVHRPTTTRSTIGYFLMPITTYAVHSLVRHDPVSDKLHSKIELTFGMKNIILKKCA